MSARPDGLLHVPRNTKARCRRSRLAAYGYDANGNMTNRGGAAILDQRQPAVLDLTCEREQQPVLLWSGRKPLEAGRKVRRRERDDDLCRRSLRESDARRRHDLAPLRDPRRAVSCCTSLQRRHARDDALPDSGSSRQHGPDSRRCRQRDCHGKFRRLRRPSKGELDGDTGRAELAKIAAVTRDGFTGHEQLDNLDLIHMNGRVYDPRIGRFISADPYVTLPYDGQGLNRYAYALNNPLALTDPSGFDPVPCVATQSGNCAKVTVIGVSWADYLRCLRRLSFNRGCERARARSLWPERKRPRLRDAERHTLFGIERRPDGGPAPGRDTVDRRAARRHPGIRCTRRKPDDQFLAGRDAVRR